MLKPRTDLIFPDLLSGADNHDDHEFIFFEILHAIDTLLS